jgi:hypothetical protein
LLFNNLLEKAAIRRVTASVSLLYILAEKNLGDLIRIHSRAIHCFDIEGERYEAPIFAALATDRNKAIESFVDVCSEYYPRDLIVTFANNL